MDALKNLDWNFPTTLFSQFANSGWSIISIPILLVLGLFLMRYITFFIIGGIVDMIEAVFGFNPFNFIRAHGILTLINLPLDAAQKVPPTSLEQLPEELPRLPESPTVDMFSEISSSKFWDEAWGDLGKKIDGYIDKF